MGLWNWLSYTTSIHLYIKGDIGSVNIPNRLLVILPLTKAQTEITKYLKVKLNIDLDKYHPCLIYMRDSKDNYIVTGMNYTKKKAADTHEIS